ncbi:uncharacterized protein [Cicer arietinum]|uniref:Heme-binding protein 2-like n=1 Tax=Cicer arietinum TaxID=3827 RepID=A0A1S2YWK8_CICAR|nr:heme-binding protein 2-like [Cicer arietinum]
MGVTTTMKISLFLSVFAVSILGIYSEVNFPAPCKQFECPVYDVIEDGKDYQIRRYNSSVWVSTPPIQQISIVTATTTGFTSLFNYKKGNNDYKQKIEMTAPVLSEVLPSDGPFIKSSFIVSFNIPKKNQANPPPAKGLQVQKWKNVYAAVRQFGGYVNDKNVVEQAAALKDSINDTKWLSAIQKSHKASNFSVAQYNNPFQLFNRVNEIWILFNLEN